MKVNKARYLTDRDEFDGTEFGYIGVGTSDVHIGANFRLARLNIYLDERMVGYNALRRDEVVRMVKKNIQKRGHLQTSGIDPVQAEIDLVLQKLGYSQ